MSTEAVTLPVVLAWHFVGATLRDGRPVPPDGETLRHDGPLKLWRSGLHASCRIIDALSYATAGTVCRVRCGGEMLVDTGKLVCRERTILWRLDADAVLRGFARECALDVVHLWKAPPVVLEYLRTGKEELRAAVWGAAQDAARAAAGDAQNKRLEAMIRAAAHAEELP